MNMHVIFARFAARWRDGASRTLMVLAVLFCLTPWASAGLALGIGLLLALSVGNGFGDLTKRYSRPLLHVSVATLGFGMNLVALAKSAREGFILALATIAITFALGAVLRRWLGVSKTTGVLVSAGTAICGGSAIAAVSAAIGAAEAEISVAMGTVFLLNAVALYLFPAVGHWLGLTQSQFGAWAGIAIHDVSSVVGAAGMYGSQALEIAATVKLSRTLWIIPVALLAGHLFKKQGDNASRGKMSIPWFIGAFVLASCAGTFVPVVHQMSGSLVHLAKSGMTLTLLMIGANLSLGQLKKVGVGPILLGIALWATISAASLGVLIKV